MASKAVERRLDAIRALTDTYLTPDGLLKPCATVARVISDIDRLRHLGRTERWASALDKWEGMVRKHSDALDWAIMQGCIYAGYGAL